MMSDQFPNDPLFRYQWFLYNTGQAGGGIGNDIRVSSVWPEYTGRGVRVAVLDTGVQMDHPDLAANVDVAASWDAVTNTPGGNPVWASENHGTPVAGLIAAVANNGIGGSGVAPDATLLAYRIFLNVPPDEGYPTPPLTGEDIVLAFNKALQNGADVINNSWGKGTAFSDRRDDPSGQALFQAITDQVTQGRDGKGAVILFANGNDGQAGYDGGLNNLTNSRHTIAVGAISNNDVRSSYSTPGANLLISAPAGADTAQVEHMPGTGVQSTDRTGTAGYNKLEGIAGDYSYNFNGTSAATPITSGVVALMLEANPDLGYRDVQEILAYSARFVDVAAEGWVTTGRGTWNGGGGLFNRDYGFGSVDAHAAVRLAEVQPFLSTAPRDESNVLFLSADSTEVETEDADSAQIQVELGNININHIDLTLYAQIENPSQFSAYLVSPQGTSIALVLRPQNALAVDAKGTPSIHAIAWPEDGFTMGSKAWWGEDSGGTWTVRLYGLTSSNALIEGVNLTIWGDEVPQARNFVFTDDYATIIANDAQRENISDRTSIAVADGETAILNAAAVSTDVKVNLAQSYATIAGIEVSIHEQTQVSSVFSGDGNDILLGDDGNNSFFAGRGSNAIDGGGGIDTLLYSGSRANYSVNFDSDGGYNITARFISDVAVNVEKVTFTEGTLYMPAATNAGLDIGVLYNGLFMRAPDAGGYEFWTVEASAGYTVDAIGANFLQTGEYAQGVGQQDNLAFVDGLYERLLEREADAAGADFWVHELDQGTVNRADVVLAFANSGEYQTTQLAGLFAELAGLGDLWA